MEDDAASKRPGDSDFKQQRLKAWQPLLTPRWVIGTFLSLGLVFVVIGTVIIVESDSIVEVRARYDDYCGPPLTNQSQGDICNLTVTIADDMDPPIYMYYELTNYYQNHRRYVKSRDDEQLRGKLSASVGDCDPIETNPSGDVIVPCGLIANSFFNDSFAADYCPSGTGCSALTLDGSDIAWDSDVDEKFKAVALPAGFSNVGADGVTLPSVADEDFIVWMRTAGLPTFKKLHRRIRTPLKAGDTLAFTINNRYPVDDFDGTKAIVLTTTGWIGGKNDFLGWAYITVGILCVLLGTVFLLKHVISPRKLGDMRYFHWSTAGASPEADT